MTSVVRSSTNGQTTNFHLHVEHTINRLRKIIGLLLSVWFFKIPCLHVHVPCLCLHVYMAPFLHVSMSQVYISMFPFLHVHAAMFPEFRKPKNGMNVKQPLPFVCYKRKNNRNNKSSAYLLICCKWKQKTEFVFLSRQRINGNRRLLFQQTYPSMPVSFDGVL
jgi:hypothetical protein